MSDFKSMLPDFKELTSMTGKLYKGIKTSVTEIIHDYKEKRAVNEAEAKEAPKKAAAEEKIDVEEVKAATQKETTAEPDEDKKS